MHFIKPLLACLAMALVEAAKSTTRTSTVTVFLPERATGSASNIYASIITSNSSKTEYLLACQTAFTSPYSCDGDFKGVTLTYAPSSDMDIAFGASTYNCTLGSSAVCATRTASVTDVGTTTLNASQSSAWMTAITVLDVDKVKTKKSSSSTITKTATSNNSGVCKRSSRSGSGSSSSDSGSGSSGSDTDSSSNSDSSDSDSSGSSTKKTGSSSCSKAARFTWDMAMVGLLGIGLGIAIVL